MEDKAIIDFLDWVANRHKGVKPLFDFCRPIGHGCLDCGYPFVTGKYRLKETECPKHQPAHWKHDKKQTLKLDQQYKRMKEAI